VTANHAPKRPKVLLIGSGPTTLSALASLATRCDVVGLVRAEEDGATAHARAAGVPVFAETSPAAIAELDAFAACDCVVISSFDRLIPAAILARRPHLNVHYAPLPRYRGRANVNWAILNGESETGVTVHSVAPGVDEGPILFQQTTPIAATDTVATLYDRLNGILARNLGDVVVRFAGGERGSLQDPAQATYGCARLPADGEIDWSWPAERIARLVRALTPPFPGAFTHLSGRRLRVLSASPSPDVRRFVGRVPGRVIGRSRREGWVDVLAGEGVLRLLSVCGDDGGAKLAAEAIGSTRDTLGLGRIELLARIEALEARVSALETRFDGSRAALGAWVHH
jgi:methionyl-tRNA formyltransferase